LKETSKWFPLPYVLALALALSLVIGVHDYLMTLLAPFKPPSKGLPWLYALINFGFWALLSPLLWRTYKRITLLKKPATVVWWIIAALGFSIVHELITTSLFYGIKLTIEQKMLTDQQLWHRLNLMLVGTFSRILEFILLVVAFTIYCYYSDYKAQQLKLAAVKGELFEIKLESLKAQLQPHFLFNTLNSISALISADPAKSRAMLSNLSQLLRALFKQDAEHLIPLAEELAYIKHYLSIEEARYSDRMQVRYQIEEGHEGVLVPKLILQPLVENAIKHGIAQCTGPGIISIEVYREENYLVMLVRDQCHNQEKSSFDWTQAGVGLTNTRERLRQLYPDQHTMKVKAKGSEFTVQLRIVREFQ